MRSAAGLEAAALAARCWRWAAGVLRGRELLADRVAQAVLSDYCYRPASGADKLDNQVGCSVSNEQLFVLMTSSEQLGMFFQPDMMSCGLGHSSLSDNEEDCTEIITFVRKNVILKHISS